MCMSGNIWCQAGVAKLNKLHLSRQKLSHLRSVHELAPGIPHRISSYSVNMAGRCNGKPVEYSKCRMVSNDASLTSSLSEEEIAFLNKIDPRSTIYLDIKYTERDSARVKAVTCVIEVE
jgi:hypothetical protein